MSRKGRSTACYYYSPDGAYMGDIKGNGAGNAALQEPAGVAVAGDTVYVADGATHRLVLFDLSGRYSEPLGR